MQSRLLLSSRRESGPLWNTEKLNAKDILTLRMGCKSLMAFILTSQQVKKEQDEEPGNLSFLDLKCKIFCSISSTRKCRGAETEASRQFSILPLPMGCSRCLEKECQKQSKWRILKPEIINLLSSGSQHSLSQTLAPPGCLGLMLPPFSKLP